MRRAVNRLLTILLFTISLSAVSSSDAATLHAIIVADTTDATLGTLIPQSETMVINLVTSASKAAGMELNLHLLEDADCRPDALFAALQSLQVKPDDAVLFHYSGHGFRTPNKIESNWPNLYFGLEGKGIKLDTVVAKLSQKKPRLLIAGADVCNSFVGDGMIPLIEKKVMKKAQANHLRDNYIRLFLKASGEIVFASSQPGQYSWYDGGGGWMTRTFVEVLSEAVIKPQTDWNMILEGMKQLTFEYGQMFQIEQVPIFNLKIQYQK